MRIEGGFFDGERSRRHAASVTVEGGLLQVRVGDGEPLAPVAIAAVEVSSRVGNTPRFLRLPGGASFETTDNDAVDRLVAASSPAAGWVHRLESRLRFVLLGLIVTVGLVWAGVQWGVPAVAKLAAFSLPADVNAHADRMVLELLDKQFLSASTLSAAEQARLQAVFAPFVADAGDQPPVRVLFRDAGKTIGPNALALPAGTIVLTDQLVALAQHDEELVAVLAHEIGHAVNRHALRRSIQASAMGLLAMLVVGDVSSVSSAATAIPLILTELGYSRAFEVEADRHAVAMLRHRGIGPQRLADVLQRLDPSKDTHGYLSTHPPTPERVQQILGY
ncbi:MAG: M48 family metallopeptidase [Azoarcus sp.]|nr:M48 family metallopeptidase [Azoarcus sp.]